MSTKPRARTGLEMVELDGELVIYDEDTSDVHYLSSTAALVFQLCDGSGTVPELAADIAEAFGVPVDQVEDQVHQLVGQFREAGLLAGSLKLVADPRQRTDEPPGPPPGTDDDLEDIRQEIRAQEPAST